MRFALLSLLLSFCAARAADISDPTQFMFVGDSRDNKIAVVSLDDNEVVHRIETSIHADHIIVTPFAPILMYTNIAERKAVFYDLKNQVESKVVDLPTVPRHAVLDTTGAKIGISDDIDGGFTLIHAYKRSIEFSLDDFPATADVLFDPNDVDIYYSNNATGSIGLLDTNTQRLFEMPLVDELGDEFSSPSRSLDARYIYVSNISTGEVYSLNAYSKQIFNSFDIGGIPARPYTTPQGAFLYMMDEESGRLVTVEQRGFTEYARADFGHGVELVAVGRFDRMNLFLSSQNKHWSVFDNVTQKIVASGSFSGTPLAALGAADGKKAYVAFSDFPSVAVVDLETQTINYVDATTNGAGAFTVGLSNNVCH
jgi:hypothetical protein